MEMDINITIEAGAPLLVSTLEDARLTVDEIGDLAAHFRTEMITSVPVQHDQPSCRILDAVIAGLNMISREAERVEKLLESLHDIAESAAIEAKEATT